MPKREKRSRSAGKRMQPCHSAARGALPGPGEEARLPLPGQVLELREERISAARAATHETKSARPTRGAARAALPPYVNLELPSEAHRRLQPRDTRRLVSGLSRICACLPFKFAPSPRRNDAANPDMTILAYPPILRPSRASQNRIKKRMPSTRHPFPDPQRRRAVCRSHPML